MLAHLGTLGTGIGEGSALVGGQLLVTEGTTAEAGADGTEEVCRILHDRHHPIAVRSRPVPWTVQIAEG